MGLYEDLRKLSERVKSKKDHVKGEEATKHALIVPFIQTLGFDTTDPLEVKPEYIADFARKKANGRYEKVDYLIMVKGEPAIFVEAKSVDAAAEEHDGQLRYYFNSTPSVKLAIVTNGLDYRFFTDLKTPNFMDEVPFLTFNILQISERAAGIIERYTKAQFDAVSVRQHAEEVLSLEKVTAYLTELLRSPSASLIKLIIEELNLVGDKKIMPSVINRYEPIVKKSIENVLFEHVKKSIQQMQAPPPAPSPEPAAQVPPQPAPPVATPASTAQRPAAEQNPNIVTTQEELEIFEIVKKICSSSPVKAPVAYKDGTNYFAINLGSNQSWFLRLYTGTQKKSFLVRLPLTKVEMLVKEFSPESVANHPEWARIYFSTYADVQKLRPLILQAYEEAARGLKTDAGE
ncbi:MAG: type I restriction endonuclease [Polyangia bacterium]